MKQLWLFNKLMAAIIILAVSVALADVPQMINYNGRLTKPNGQPVADGPYLIKFIIYDAPTIGNELWNSTYQTVQVTDGLFEIRLGESPMPPIPDTIFNASPDRWLGITVGTDSEIDPRTRFTSVGYAYHALRADTASNVGIPFSLTSTEVEPIISGRNDGSGVGVKGEHSTSGNYGYLGGSEYGVKGQYDTDNFGFLGSSNYGVYGKHFSTGNEGYLGGSGLAVFGKHMGSGNEGHLGGSSNAVYGLSTSGYAGFFNGKVHVNGDVGIGTPTPDERLTVDGNLHVTGDLIVDGTLPSPMVDYGEEDNVPECGTREVTFNVQFSAPPVVVAGYKGNHGCDEHGNWFVSNVTTSGFTLRNGRPNAPEGRSAYWIAVGLGQ